MHVWTLFRWREICLRCYCRSFSLLGLQSPLLLEIYHARAPFRPSQVDYIQKARELFIPRILAVDLDLEYVMTPGRVLVYPIATKDALTRGQFDVV